MNVQAVRPLARGHFRHDVELLRGPRPAIGQDRGSEDSRPEKTAAFEARFNGLGKPQRGRDRHPVEASASSRRYEYGMTTEGAPYMLMEYLEGPNVNSALAARDPS